MWTICGTSSTSVVLLLPSAYIILSIQLLLLPLIGTISWFIGRQERLVGEAGGEVLILKLFFLDFRSVLHDENDENCTVTLQTPYALFNYIHVTF